MRTSKRIAGAVLAASLIAGGSVAFAAPAQAATWATRTVGQSGFWGLIDCQVAERNRAAAISRSGGQVFAGDACGWRGSTLRYGYSITYRYIPGAGL